MTSHNEHASLTNLEGLQDYDITWPWEQGDLTSGMTAVLRVKNEARSLPWVLPPLFQAAEYIVLVDNNSDDGTPDVARSVATEVGRDSRLVVREYPFQVSRCGPEHLHTPARSIHSLAYFYNWSFSQVATTYSMKWDGDMVLTQEGVDTFADLSWQLQTTEAVATMPRHPLFIESDRIAYLDVGMRNVEEYVFPMRPGYTHVKAFEWELRLYPDDTTRLRLPEGLCVELKHLDSDEFSHWTDPDAFANSYRTQRKRREWAVFNALVQGRWEGLEAIERIEAPAGMHVIDYVTNHWLPRAERPLVKEPLNV